MFKLIKLFHEEQSHYVLVDGTTETIVNDDQKGFMLLGATFKMPNVESNLHLINIDDIDELILMDKNEANWEVEVDQDFKIYLKSQTI